MAGDGHEEGPDWAKSMPDATRKGTGRSSAWLALIILEGIRMSFGVGEKRSAGMRYRVLLIASGLLAASAGVSSDRPTLTRKWQTDNAPAALEALKNAPAAAEAWRSVAVPRGLPAGNHTGSAGGCVRQDHRNRK